MISYNKLEMKIGMWWPDMTEDLFVNFGDNTSQKIGDTYFFFTLIL